jgi:hypothetical protein
LSSEIFCHILDKLSFKNRFAFFRSLSDALMPGKDAVFTEARAETSESEMQRSIRSPLGFMTGKKKMRAKQKPRPHCFQYSKLSVCRTLTALT